jgi:putative ABC transport system permease protein
MLLYRVRLRPRAVQELFAIVGIAVGVGLLFSSQIASTSLDGSMQELVNGVVGGMRLQLAARSPQGFEQRLLGEVQQLPGVRSVFPALEEHVSVIGPTGEATVDLLSTEARFAHLAGPLMHHFTADQLEHQQALALPLPVAQSIGLSSLEPVKLRIGARIVQSFIGTVLLARDIGGLINSAVVVTSIPYAQQLLGLPGRLTRIFVQPAPGREGEVRSELLRLAAGQLNVQPAGFDATLFKQAAGPADQSAVLFSAISALVGFLFAFNALLFTVPQRKHLVEDLRLDGYARRMILEVLLFDALVLGVVASLLGLLVGDLLSLLFFHSNPGYLSFAFSLSSLRIITWQSVLLAAGVGLMAAFVGVLVPLRADIFSPLSLAAKPKWRRRGGTAQVLVGGLGCLAITTVILLVAPQAAIAGIVSLVVALLLLLPVLIRAIVIALDRGHRTLRGAASYLAVVELKSNSNQARSLAIAATGAIAVFGSVAILGAQSNLETGLDASARDIDANAAVWVSVAGESNAFATTPFSDTLSGTLAHLPGVSAVRLYRGSFLDWGERRIWVLAPPRLAANPIPPSQLERGDLARATAAIRAGGWAVLSQSLARQHRLHIGEWFTLPSPRPVTLRLAALSTNLGWPPGAIILGAEDYVRAWGSDDPSAYQLQVDPGVSPAVVRDRVQRALGSQTGLVAETSSEREQYHYAQARASLSRLTQIATLMLIAAILAMAAAMGAMIWQRRTRLADMKVDGFGKGILWRSLLIESGLLLGAGCSIGAVFGIYGQLVLSHALATVTGFPIVFSVGALVAVGSCLLVTAVAVLVVAIPGYIAVRVRPAIILQD